MMWTQPSAARIILMLLLLPSLNGLPTGDINPANSQISDNPNAVVTVSNGSAPTETENTTAVVKTTKGPPPDVLPEKGSEEKEHQSSMAIFFILFILVLSIMVVHGLLVSNCHYLPESLAIVSLGAFVGFILKFSDRDWTKEEAFSPNIFFLLLLPPIIFEGGYNLHKGNFFANIGSILAFAVVGTGISAIVVGGGIYILGQADLIYELTAVESFAFGSMISAVDPVATLAIFHAIKVEPVLYMLVFGESMLNDAVAIVLTQTVLELESPAMANLPVSEALIAAIGRFNLVFFASAGLGIAAGLLSALLLKFVDLRRTPSLEFGIMLIFAYLPYGLAEGLHLSGIMAILFCGVTMSHYTHYNLSPMTQITMQQTFRTLAFMCETCVFAYLGMAFFTFPLIFEPVFIIWAIVLCLLGRAMNIFPLSYLVNIFREHKITKKSQFIMWFSGLRGAIAVALSMHMEFAGTLTRRIMITNTLMIVLFTIMVLGGGTMPLLKFLEKMEGKDKEAKKLGKRKRRRRRRSRNRSGAHHSGSEWTLSKTHELGQAIEAECSYSDYTTDADFAPRDSLQPPGEAVRVSRMILSQLKGLANLDAKYFRPLFIRKFTQKEKKESTLKLTDMALEWYQGVEEEDEVSEEDVVFENSTGTLRATPKTVAATDTLSSDDHTDSRPLI